jgi:single-strand DNA-binding protein
MLNRCCFIGNLGRDPEIRVSQAGKEIATLNLAVTEKWKDASGERKERTEWVRCTVFNEGLIKIVKVYLKKGSKIYLEGQLTTRKYTDKEGIEKYATEIVLSNFNGIIKMLDSAKNEDQQSNEAPLASQVVESMEEIPF